MEYRFVKRCTSLFRNGVPLSEIILLGTPKRHIIFSLKKLTIELIVAFFRVTTSTHLVNSLVATNIHVHPSEEGFVGPIKSYPLRGMDMEPQLDEDSDGWCVFHLLAFGSFDTSLQSFKHPFALWASNIPGTKPFATTFSHLDVLLVLLHVGLKERH